MSRGFISGIVWGLVIAVLLLAVVSLNKPLPGDAPPSTGTAEVPAGSQFNGAREDGPVDLPAQEGVTAPAAAGGLTTPQRDGLDTLSTTAMEPGQRPTTGTPEGGLSAAPEAGQAPETPAAPLVETPTTNTARPAEALPAAPGDDTAPVAPVRPAPPSSPSTQLTVPAMPQEDAGAGTSGFAAGDLQSAAEAPRPRPGAPDATISVPAAAERSALPAADTAAGVQPAAPEAPAAPMAGAGEAGPVAPAPEASGPGAATTDRADAPAVDRAPDAVTEPAARPDPVARAEAGETPPPLNAETEEALAQNLATRMAGNIIDRGTGAGGRLPVIGQAPAEPEAAEEPAAPAVAPEGVPPIRANATSFENDTGLPLMSIVLIDGGADAATVAAVGDFPFPVSVALDPAAPGAAEAMRRYRDAGIEVLILAGVDAAARAQDVETDFQVWADRLPQAVAVMEKPGLGLQQSKDAADHMGAMLADSGYGLVLYPNGFDTARKLASKAGVPAATVFRDFDAEGQGEAVIRRFLDHAAFRARQSDGVIMVGRLRPETLQALAVWGLQDRAGQVALAPVSALLLAQPAGEG
ncbi:divergent polysaccharide deacetylase family protein [Pseudooceanicola sp. LIPI14-2-Ac024]|uniref:divergent polysaccharide deacteylase family protein n=1 Tax=Pseudooceanicola sp. LIPI14-2-Ac024 TaxID=3344875 RepID=UPI0035CF18CE